MLNILNAVVIKLQLGVLLNSGFQYKDQLNILVSRYNYH